MSFNTISEWLSLNSKLLLGATWKRFTWLRLPD